MNIHEELVKVVRNNGIFKFVDVGEGEGLLGDGVLSVEKFNEFIKELRNETVILQNSRFLPMTSDKKEIDLMGMRIELEAPTRDGTTNEYSLTSQAPTFNTNRLSAELLMAKTMITYEALEDNIAGGQLESDLATSFGQAAGEALERVFVYGDTDETDGAVATGYKAIDGWIKKGKNILYGAGASSDFTGTDIIDTFEKMYDALDPKYRKNAVYYVPDTVNTGFRRLIRDKDTDLGDECILKDGSLGFEGRPIVPAPVLDEPITNEDFFGPVAMFLTNPTNLVHGLKRQVMVESDKDILNQWKRYVLSLRGDCHFEMPDKTVIALPNEEPPAG